MKARQRQTMALGWKKSPLERGPALTPTHQPPGQPCLSRAWGKVLSSLPLCWGDSPEPSGELAGVVFPLVLILSFFLPIASLEHPAQMPTPPSRKWLTYISVLPLKHIKNNILFCCFHFLLAFSLSNLLWILLLFIFFYFLQSAQWENRGWNSILLFMRNLTVFLSLDPQPWVRMSNTARKDQRQRA